MNKFDEGLILNEIPSPHLQSEFDDDDDIEGVEFSEDSSEEDELSTAVPVR